MDNPRAVLHIITRLDPGGSAESTIQQAKAWSDPKTRYLVATGGDTFPEGSEVIRISHLRREIDPKNDFLALLEIIRLIRKIKPDIVHTHSSKAGVLGRLAVALCRRPGRPSPKVVHTPHGHVLYGYFGPVKSWVYRAIEIACVPWTDLFVALTEGEKRESVDFGIGAADRWRVVPSGTEIPENPEAFAAQGTELRRRYRMDSIVIGSLMRLEVVKGPHVWMEASALAAKSSPIPLSFFVVGTGEMLEELKERASALGVSRLWVFAGHTDRVFEHLAAMDIYVQPSLNEGMGRALVQAQGMELPVVASRVCGIPWAVKDGESALLVPPNDPAALSRAIVRLAGDEHLRRRMGSAGRRWVSSPDDTGFPRFSPRVAQSRLAAVYAEIFPRDGGHE